MKFCLFGSTVDRQLAADKWSGGSRAWLPLLLDLSCGLSSAAMSLRPEPTARRSKSKSSASCRAKLSASVPPSHQTLAPSATALSKAVMVRLVTHSDGIGRGADVFNDLAVTSSSGFTPYSASLAMATLFSCPMGASLLALDDVRILDRRLPQIQGPPSRANGRPVKATQSAQSRPKRGTSAARRVPASQPTCLQFTGSLAPRRQPLRLRGGWDAGHAAARPALHR